jgi:hypothetical protein
MAQAKSIVFCVRMHIWIEYVVARVHDSGMAPGLKPCEQHKAIRVRGPPVTYDLQVGSCDAGARRQHLRGFTHLIDYEELVGARVTAS